jgi:hypothetical protein
MRKVIDSHQMGAMKRELPNILRWVLAVIFLQLSLLVFPTSAVPPQEPLNVPYCDLLAGSQTYEGKSVLTTAIIGSNEHDTMVYDASCRSTSTDNKSADMEFPSDWTTSKLGKKLSTILQHHESARVNFVATFSQSAGPYGMLGARYRLTLIRLISVEKAPHQ